MRFLWSAVFLACIITAAGWTGLTVQPWKVQPPRLPKQPSLEVNMVQAGDSIVVTVRWKAPATGGRYYPIDRYLVRLVEQRSGDTLAASQVDHPTTEAVFQFPLPPLGDSTAGYAALTSVDTAGSESAREPGGPTIWALSDPFIWLTTPLPPLLPESVTVDTSLGVLVIDSLLILTHANAPQLPDGSYLIPRHDTLRMAAVLYSGSAAVECCCQRLTDPLGTHPCDQVELSSLRPLLQPGQRLAPFIRSSGFKVSGDLSRAHKVTMAARGTFLLPEYARQRRALYAHSNRTAGSDE